MTTASAAKLSRAEQGYVNRVADQLDWLPRRTREDLLDALRQNLAERARRPRGDAGSGDSIDDHLPEADWPAEFTALSRELGSPANYAATLVAEMERADPGFTAGARRRRRWRLSAVLTAWVVVLGSGLGAFAWWMTWDPGFRAVMDRFCIGQPSVDRCDQAGIADLAPADMVQVSCVTGRTLTIAIGLTTDHPVTVTGASLVDGVGVGNIRPDGSPFGTQKFRLTAIEPWLRPDTSSFPQRAAWPVKFDDNAVIPEVHFEMDLCPGDGYPPPMPGSSLIFEDFELHYRALGRDHVATVPFPRAIAITRLP